jgi:hypothetical protein
MTSSRAQKRHSERKSVIPSAKASFRAQKRHSERNDVILAPQRHPERSEGSTKLDQFLPAVGEGNRRLIYSGIAASRQ